MLNLIQIGALWLIGWAVIIISYGIGMLWIKSGHIGQEYQDVGSSFVDIVRDGNNLFTTGLAYFIGNLTCYFIDIPILHYTICIAGIIFAVLPVLSAFVFAVVSIVNGDRYRRLNAFTATINSVIPLLMAVNIYFTYIQK